MVPANGEAAKQTSKKVKRSKANMKAREKESVRDHGVPGEDRALAPWWPSRGSWIHTGNDRNQIGANHHQSISVKMRTAQRMIV